MTEPRIGTELGELPASWRVAPLGEFLSEAQYGASVKGGKSGSYPILRMTNQVNGSISSANLQYADISAREFETFRVQRGDILFNRTNSFELVGRTAIFDLDGDYVFASYLIRLRAIAPVLDPFFLNVYLNAAETQRRLKAIATRAVSQSNISASRLRTFVVPLPPIGEQRKIAAVLGLVQQAMELQEQLMGLTAALKKALLHQLFTAGLRAEPQKQTDIGPVPKSWEVATLDHAAVAFDYGTSVKCEHGITGVPVLRIPNVVGGSIDLTDLKYGNPKRNEVGQLRLQDGDLLFVRTNGVLENAGRCALYRGELDNCYFASYLIRVRVDSSKVVPAFVNEYARTERGRSFLSGRAIRTADGKFNINSGTLKRVLLPLPSLNEQEEIVRQLNLVDRKLKLHEAKLKALAALFRTLLHELMTAQIRVNDLHLPELERVGKAQTPSR